MTNPISKAIVKAAVAMGYGKKSDYKGSSVADVLEKFAAIAKDKGGSSGGGIYAVTMEEIDGNFTLNKTAQEIITACQSQIVLFSYATDGQALYAPCAVINVTTQGTVDIIFGQLSFNATTINDYPVLMN